MMRHPGYTQAGKACTAPLAEWVIVDYRCNYSAFNGYHHTASNYSSLRCNRCGERWRTKAKYVDRVPTQERS